MVKRILLLALCLMQTFAAQPNIHEEFKNTFASVDLSKGINPRIFDKFKLKSVHDSLIQRSFGKKASSIVSSSKRNEKIVSLTPWCKNFPELLADFEVTTTKKVNGQVASLVQNTQKTAAICIEESQTDEQPRVGLINLETLESSDEENLQLFGDFQVSSYGSRIIQLKNGYCAALHPSDGFMTIIDFANYSAKIFQHSHLRTADDDDDNDEGDKLSCVIEIDQSIITFSNDGVVTKWGNVFKTNYEIKEVFELNLGISCATKIDKRNIALGLSNGMIAVYDYVNNGTTLFQGHNQSIQSITKLKNGKLLSCADDGTMIVWKMRSMEIEKFYTLSNNSIRSAIELADGNIAFVSEMGQMHNDVIAIFDSKNEKVDRTFNLLPFDYVHTIVQLNNSKIAAAVSKKLMIFDLYGQVTEELTLEQTVLYVQLIRNFIPNECLFIHADWMKIFKTLPEVIQSMFYVEELVQERQEQYSEEAIDEKLENKEVKLVGEKRALKGFTSPQRKKRNAEQQSGSDSLNNIN